MASHELIPLWNYLFLLGQLRLDLDHRDILFWFSCWCIYHFNFLVACFFDLRRLSISFLIFNNRLICCGIDLCNSLYWVFNLSLKLNSFYSFMTRISLFFDRSWINIEFQMRRKHLVKMRWNAIESFKFLYLFWNLANSMSRW